MLRMFAGSVVDSALIVSALRGVACQDAFEAALASGLDLVLYRYQVVVQFSLG